MERKIAAGAQFFQTQAVYDPVLFSKFMKRVEPYKVPVLAGVIPLKSAGMAKFMNKSVAGVCVPQAMIDKISKAEDKARTGIEMCAELIKELKGCVRECISWPSAGKRKYPRSSRQPEYKSTLLPGHRLTSVWWHFHSDDFLQPIPAKAGIQGLQYILIQVFPFGIVSFN